MLSTVLVLLGGCASVSADNIVIPQPGEAISAHAAVTPGWNVEPLLVERPDATLRGALFRKAGATATVLYFGGNGFVLARHHPHLLAIYQSLPVNVVAFDHRGYAGSSGHASLNALLEDGVALYDHVRAMSDAADGPLLLHGHSLGSFVAGRVARERTLDGLVLESSATSTEDWVQDFVDRTWWLLKVRISGELKGQGNAAVMPTLDEPLLVVVGRNDLTTSPAMSQALFAQAGLPAQRKELLVVADAAHMDATRKPAYGDAFARLLQRATPGGGVGADGRVGASEQ